jgi:eukaryotic-like serine/threonine-protein kinase
VSESSAYRLVRRIGWGPGGPVYVARGAAGEVAIRQFPSEEAARGNRESFLAAGRQQMTLTDPSIVPTLEVVDGPEEASVVMEYVEADTLQSALRSRPFSLEETNTLLRRVALALDFAHSRGVVHGDVKPSNIFLLPNQEVMVGDFAISPSVCRDVLQPLPLNLRHGYLSPEHFSFPMLLEARSDQYSLAVIAYEMYAGHLPFGGSPDYAAGLGEAMPPSRVNPKLDPGVDPPVMRALSRNPAHRFNSCMEFISDLSATLIAAPQASKEKRGILPLVLGLAALLAIVAGFLLFRPGKKPERPPQVARVEAPVNAPPLPAPAQPPKRQKRPSSSPPAAKSDAPPPAPARNLTKTDSAPPIATKKITTAVRPVVTTVRNPTSPDPAPAAPANNFTIEVLSRSRRIPKGASFAIDEPTLGELGHGDLKALVRVEGPSLRPGHLTIEWTVDGVVTDRQKPALPDKLVDYENEPALGAYKVTVRLDGSPVADFMFRITP